MNIQNAVVIVTGSSSGIGQTTAIRFAKEGAGTRISDDVDYELPLGPLGRAIEALWARREIAKIFAYRTEVIARRFS